MKRTELMGRNQEKANSLYKKNLRRATVKGAYEFALFVSGHVYCAGKKKDGFGC